MASLTYSAAKVSFQSQSEFGVYDLTNNNAKPIRTYTRVQDQYAIRYTNSGMTFRIQSIVNNYLIALKLPNSVGNNTSMTIYAYGNAGISSGTVKVNLVKQDGVKLWLEDTTNKRGYIIASDIEQ